MGGRTVIRTIECWRFVVFGMLSLLVWAPGVAAQATRPAAATTKSDTDGSGADKSSEEEDQWLALTGATLHTVTEGTWPGATILVKNDKIAALGYDVEIPEGATVVAADGHHIYPGLIAVRSGRIVGRRAPADSTDLYGLNLVLGLAGGLTTVVSDNSAIKLTYGTVDGMVLKSGLFETLRYSSTRPSERQKVRQGLARVEQYLRDLDHYQREKRRDPELEEPDKRWIRGDYAKYLRLLRGESRALVSAQTAGDITDYCQLADRFGIGLVIDGAAEGWLVPGELARCGASAIITPRTRIDRNEAVNRPNGSSIENARILQESGVRFAVIPRRSSISTGGTGGQDLLHLNLEAAFAVRGGLSQEAAIRAITIDAAHILGVERRVGSLEVGKDADFIVVDGDLLHYQTLVRWSIVNGRVVYDRMKDTLFDHIRPEDDPDAPPVVDGWPRSLGEDW